MLLTDPTFFDGEGEVAIIREVGGVAVGDASELVDAFDEDGQTTAEISAENGLDRPCCYKDVNNKKNAGNYRLRSCLIVGVPVKETCRI